MGFLGKYTHHLSAPLEPHQLLSNCMKQHDQYLVQWVWISCKVLMFRLTDWQGDLSSDVVQKQPKLFLAHPKLCHRSTRLCPQFWTWPNSYPVGERGFCHGGNPLAAIHTTNCGWIYRVLKFLVLLSQMQISTSLNFKRPVHQRLTVLRPLFFVVVVVFCREHWGSGSGSASEIRNAKLR